MDRVSKHLFELKQHTSTNNVHTEYFSKMTIKEVIHAFSFFLLTRISIHLV